MAYSYLCPFCNQITVVNDENYHSFKSGFNKGNVYGYQVVTGEVEVCSNPDCKKYSLSVNLHCLKLNDSGGNDRVDLNSWKLVPESNAKVLPDYIPVALINDYTEACRIKNLSPKASATLSRRCLQGMIRDFWSIKKDTLYKEINELQSKVDDLTWEAIDSMRKVGNIGAHMEKDVNFIIDVEPDEAELMINLIENLFSDWYVNRYQREERMKKMVNIANSKKNKK